MTDYEVAFYPLNLRELFEAFESPYYDRCVGYLEHAVDCAIQEYKQSTYLRNDECINIKKSALNTPAANLYLEQEFTHRPEFLKISNRSEKYPFPEQYEGIMPLLQKHVFEAVDAFCDWYGFNSNWRAQIKLYALNVPRFPEITD